MHGETELSLCDYPVETERNGAEALERLKAASWPKVYSTAAINASDYPPSSRGNVNEMAGMKVISINATKIAM